MLQDLGFDVSTTQNGQEALDQFKKSKLYTFDYIFMDIMMPIKNGLEATREIRVLPRRDAKNVHILAMSANAFESDIQECIKASMDGHIAKPIDMELLKEKEYIKLDRDKSTFKSHRDFSSEKEITFKHF